MAENPQAYSFQSTPMVDYLMHGKMDNGEEVILLPFTRYDNLLGSPKIVDDLDSFPGAPFFFLKTDEIELSQEEVEALLGTSINLTTE